MLHLGSGLNYVMRLNINSVYLFLYLNELNLDLRVETFYQKSGNFPFEPLVSILLY